MPVDDESTAAHSDARESLEEALAEATRRRRVRLWLGTAVVLVVAALTSGALPFVR